jgi:hypothetical protein
MEERDMKNGASESRHFRIQLKDLRDYMQTHEVLYAADEEKELWVLLAAGPGVKRYIVKSALGEERFAKARDAVRHFNSL